MPGFGSPGGGSGGAAASLETTGAPVVVNTANPPSIGQVLTATSPTAANWQTPSTDPVLTPFSVAFTAAQIKAMFATPRTLVAASPGKVIVPVTPISVIYTAGLVGFVTDTKIRIGFAGSTFVFSGGNGSSIAFSGTTSQYQAITNVDGSPVIDLSIASGQA